MSHDTTPTKVCSKCGQEYPATTEFFHRSNRTKDGLNTHCKACRHEASIRHQQARLERLANITPPTEPKICDVCGDEFPRTDEFWHKNKYKIDGLSTTCRQCAIERTRHWYAEHGAEQNAERQERMNTDPEYREKRLKQGRNTYYRYQEEKNRISRQYYAENRERIRNEYWPQHYAENRQSFIERTAQWRENNPEQYYSQNKKHKAKRRQIILSAEGSHTAANIRTLYDEQEGRCAYCGITLHNSFHLDHIIPLIRGGSNNPDNLACACAACNLSKGEKLLDEWIAWRGW